MAVATHYAHNRLLQAIEDGLDALGLTSTTVTMADLAPVDEFHIGGRSATVDLLNQLNVQAGFSLLDIGCGLGGPARAAVSEYDCTVSGIDMTEDFVQTGLKLNQWLDLNEKIDLRVGDAMHLPWPDHTFDAAYMLHVGMNIADKPGLAQEVFRVLKPEARFGIYDIMQIGDENVDFPVPWASSAEESWLAPPQTYAQAVTQAGFCVTHQRNRHGFAVDTFDKMRRAAAAKSTPPPLGLHVTMGQTAATKIANMVGAVRSGIIAPVEIIGRKPAKSPTKEDE